MRATSRRSYANPVEELVFQVKAANLPEPERELRFHETRKWKIDLAWRRLEPVMFQAHYPMQAKWAGLAVEVEGGAFLPGGSRHTRGAGFEADCEKYAELAIAGYKLLRVTPRHIRDGRALGWIEKLLR